MPRNIEKTLRGCFHPKEGKPNLQKVPVNVDCPNNSQNVPNEIQISKLSKSVKFYYNQFM